LDRADCSSSSSCFRRCLIWSNTTDWKEGAEEGSSSPARVNKDDILYSSACVFLAPWENGLTRPLSCMRKKTCRSDRRIGRVVHWGNRPLCWERVCFASILHTAFSRPWQDWQRHCISIPIIANAGEKRKGRYVLLPIESGWSTRKSGVQAIKVVCSSDLPSAEERHSTLEKGTCQEKTIITFDTVHLV
jgi:hypothetical protein